jgi:hypothetical protein
MAVATTDTRKYLMAIYSFPGHSEFIKRELDALQCWYDDR